MQISFHGNFDDETRGFLARNIEANLQESRWADAEICIYFNFPYKSKLDISKFNVLLLQEPRSVIPWQYQSKILSKFNLIIPFGPWRANSLRIPHWVYVPYKFTELPKFQNKNRDIWLSMVNAAKYSSGQTSNYGLRRQISKMLGNGAIDFRLFGWNWNSSYLKEFRERSIALRNGLIAREKISIKETLSTLFHRFEAYQGGIDDKSEVMLRSELTLVIENDSDYVTEKILDAFTYRSVPIYVGPSFDEFFPAVERCIFRCNNDVKSILETIERITEREIKIKRDAINSLMANNELIQQFSYSKVWSNVTNLIVKTLINSRSI